MRSLKGDRKEKAKGRHPAHNLTIWHESIVKIVWFLCLEWYRLIRFVGFSGFKIARICNLLVRAWACRWARAVVVALVCWRDEGWTGRNTEPVLQSHTNSAKARKEKKTEGQRIHPWSSDCARVCAVTKVYISNFVACFSERDWRCDVVIQSPISLETSAKVKSMLFPRPDTAYHLRHQSWKDDRGLRVRAMCSYAQIFDLIDNFGWKPMVHQALVNYSKL